MPRNGRPQCPWGLVVVPCLLGIHASLLAVNALRCSPTLNEPFHLASGLDCWRTGHVATYLVNPPLVRCVAVLPLLTDRAPRTGAAVPASDRRWSEWVDGEPQHPWGQWVAWALPQALLVCILFALLGALVSWKWTTELGGRWAGNVALALWTLSPGILGHGALMTADVPSASFALLAAWRFHRVLCRPTWATCVAAGAALGLALLSKFTCLVLVPCYALVWAVHRRWSPTPESAGVTALVRPASVWRVLLVLATGLLVLNAGYSFDRTGTPITGLRLESQSAVRLCKWAGLLEPKASWVARMWRNLPLPVPAAYVEGIDEQVRDFERFHWTFMAGHWRDRGAWYYYIYALAVKAPLGHWFVFVLTLGACTVLSPSMAVRSGVFMPAITAAVIFMLVSAQTSWNAHARYILPAAGFVFVGIASVLAQARERVRWLGPAVVCGLVASGASVAWHYPHMLNYFNELAGGPSHGYLHLRGSNTDWGQDFYLLRAWLERHPEALPIVLDAQSGVQAEALGIDYIPLRDLCSESGSTQSSLKPGWYAISVNALDAPDGPRIDWSSLPAAAHAGHTIRIYRVAP